MNLLDALNKAASSSAGQVIATAVADRASDEIWGLSGFGSEEVDSPTARVEAPRPVAPTNPLEQRKALPGWVKPVGIASAIAFCVGLYMYGGKKAA
ncbi:MAG: hypothetical protein KAU94_02255 [Verrucomicrobia bacterium]|nr:hypothetical protein [Verrucomicrobiota bacterium]